MTSQHLYVITGASGAGKSTLVAALGDLGYSTIPEAALAILREHRERGDKALPATDRAAFMEAVLLRSLDDYEKAHALEPPVFFDRGIPEWLRFASFDGDRCKAIAAQHRYAGTVFVADPWPEIYVRDHERTHSFDRAAASYVPTVSAYVEAGYETRILPKVSVEERVAFILAHVDAGAQRVAAADHPTAAQSAGG
jgi:predicted ATPase